MLVNESLVFSMTLLPVGLGLGFNVLYCNRIAPLPSITRQNDVGQNRMFMINILWFIYDQNKLISAVFFLVVVARLQSSQDTNIFTR